MLNVLFAAIIGGFSLGQAAPNLQACIYFSSLALGRQGTGRRSTWDAPWSSGANNSHFTACVVDMLLGADNLTAAPPLLCLCPTSRCSTLPRPRRQAPGCLS